MIPDENDWPFCECGATLLDGEDECPTCAGAPHGRDCFCDECETYWHDICEASKQAAERANRALVCSCGWTGAFIEHHDSQAYGPVARVGCEITYREPADAREQLVRRTWTAAGWQHVPTAVQR